VCLGCVARLPLHWWHQHPARPRVVCISAPGNRKVPRILLCALGEVAVRARVFIDFWNFQLGWNEVSGDSRCDWRAVPRLLVHEAKGVLATTGSSDTLTVEETIVHASVNQTTETKLSDWLTNWLDRQPSFDVKIRNRRTRKRAIYCKACGATATNCPSCQAPLSAAVEKGVDAALVTGLLSLAWRRAYDVASLFLETPTIFLALPRMLQGLESERHTRINKAGDSVTVLLPAWVLLAKMLK
jgi:hypothetical protein